MKNPPHFKCKLESAVIFKVKFEVTQMNLTSLINKSAKALALSAAFVAAPFLAHADDAQKPADHLNRN